MAQRLLDQRDMHRATTVEEVRTRWFDLASRLGIELVPSDLVVAAYVNHGRWVADCPECGGGIACWDANPAGACLDCGHIYSVAFPESAAVAARLLVKRPKMFTRNWRPDQQDIDALRRENTLTGAR